jgi:hypothetical protein
MTNLSWQASRCWGRGFGNRLVAQAGFERKKAAFFWPASQIFQPEWAISGEKFHEAGRKKGLFASKNCLPNKSNTYASKSPLCNKPVVCGLLHPSLTKLAHAAAVSAV